MKKGECVMQIITEKLATEFNNFASGKMIKPVEYNRELAEILKLKNNEIISESGDKQKFSFLQLIKFLAKKFLTPVYKSNK